MAATLIVNPQEYIGTNAERIAMSTTGVKAGATFFETDTKNIYIYSGSAWVAI
jgi:hypothetical protein